MKRIAPLVLCLLTACATSSNTRIVRFESEPAGAHIFIAYAPDEKSPANRTYIGKAPCHTEIPVDRKGWVRVDRKSLLSPPASGQPIAIFIAEWSDGSTNRLIFHSGADATVADKIPPALLIRR